MWLCALCVIGERQVCRRTNRTTRCYLVPEEGSTLGLGSISPKPLIMGRECENKRVKSESIKLHNNDSLNNQCTVRGGNKFCVHSKLISYGAALPTFVRNFPPPSVGVRQIQAFPSGRELNFVIKNDWRSLRFFFFIKREDCRRECVRECIWEITLLPIWNTTAKLKRWQQRRDTVPIRRQVRGRESRRDEKRKQKIKPQQQQIKKMIMCQNFKHWKARS